MGADGTGGSPQAGRELFALLRGLATEQRNPRTRGIDLADPEARLRLLHAEDRMVADVVEAAIPGLVPIVERATDALRRGGRLVYAGAGTSGRLGVLDAAECPPTYGTAPEQVLGLIAGGHGTLVRSREGVEDRPEDGACDVDAHDLGASDVLVGISASRRTPYVHGALTRARERGAWTAFLVCNRLDPAGPDVADHVVEVEVGPEPITGSTRMKSALAQKMMLTMLSTATMVGLGKVYENLMVDVQPTSQKLRERAKGLVMTLADVDYEEAARLLAEARDDVKVATTMAVRGVDAATARALLEDHAGLLRKVLEP